MSKISPCLWFDGDGEAGRVVPAMLGMTKIDVAGLRAAYDGVEEEDRRGAAQ